jgi:DNA polymerase-3 subunit epsilon
VPAAVARPLVDEVVRADARLAWRSSHDVGLAAWREERVAIEDATYCVVDLETTGARAAHDRIVEIGAVRIRALELEATFERLVDPGVPLPGTISRLTGIAPRDLRGRGPVGPALDAFLAFAGDAVLVAHNARFDVGFLDAALRRRGGRRLACPVLDTVALARAVLQPRPRRLSLRSLAERFDTTVAPCHRALPDAQATAELLLVFLGRAQERGARTLDDLLALGAPAPRRALARRHLAEAAPRAPGTYVMRTRGGVPLYVGTAGDLRRRVRSYYRATPGTAAERPVDRVLPVVDAIDYARAGSAFEARLDEIALIAELRPGANRRGARPERSPYLRLATHAPGRLDVGVPREGVVLAGPLHRRRDAERAVDGLRLAYGLRGCRAARPEEGTCLEGRLGRCLAPCRGPAQAAAHAAAVAEVQGLLLAGGAAPVARLRERRAALSAEQRFEEAARLRDAEAALRRVGASLRTLRRARRRHGVVLAAHLDPRLVQAFGVAHGLVVARRPLPRAGDGALEAAALAGAVARAVAAAPVPGPVAVEAGRGDEVRLVEATFARPPGDLVVVPLAGAEAQGALAEAVALARARVPARG